MFFKIKLEKFDGVSKNDFFDILQPIWSQFGFEKSPRKRALLPFLRYSGSLCNGDTKTFDSKANKNQASVLRGKTLTRRDSTILFLIL